MAFLQRAMAAQGVVSGKKSLQANLASVGNPVYHCVRQHLPTACILYELSRQHQGPRQARSLCRQFLDQLALADSMHALWTLWQHQILCQ